MRQNGVTAWNTGWRASEYVTDARRSATNSRCTRVFEFAMVRLVPGVRRVGEAPSDCRWEIVAPNSIDPHAHAIARLDLSKKPRLACAMANSTQDGTPDELAAMKPEVASLPSAHMHRAAFEEQVVAQRIRNASAVVRARQKVARERRKPVQHPR